MDASSSSPSLLRAASGPRRPSTSARRLPAYSLATALALLLTAAGQMPVPQLKLVSIVRKDLDAHEATAPMSIPRYDLARNRLIYDQLDVHVAVEGGFDPEDHLFRINGLLNPDIQIPLGARLVITLAGMRFPAAFMLAPRPPVPGEFTVMRAVPIRELRVGPVFGQDFARTPPRRLSSKVLDVAIATYQAQTLGTVYWSNSTWTRGCYGRIIVVP